MYLLRGKSGPNEESLSFYFLVFVAQLSIKKQMLLVACLSVTTTQLQRLETSLIVSPHKQNQLWKGYWCCDNVASVNKPLSYL